MVCLSGNCLKATNVVVEGLSLKFISYSVPVMNSMLVLHWSVYANIVHMWRWHAYCKK